MGLRHEMHIDSIYFSLLKEGKKRVELRVNDEKRRQIMPGDKICFLSREHTDGVVTLNVSKKLISDSFESLLKDIPAVALGGISEEKQIQELRRFYTEDEVTTWGVVAFMLGGEQNDKR